METWQFYATRGIVKSYRFDNSQIEKGLEIGISPEIKISHKHLTAPIQRDFALYGKRMGFEDFYQGLLKKVSVYSQPLERIEPDPLGTAASTGRSHGGRALRIVRFGIRRMTSQNSESRIGARGYGQ